MLGGPTKCTFRYLLEVISCNHFRFVFFYWVFVVQQTHDNQYVLCMFIIGNCIHFLLRVISQIEGVYSHIKGPANKLAPFVLVEDIPL